MWIYFKMKFIPVIKAVFSISFLQSSVTWSSEIILIYLYDAQETFLIIINVENSYDAAYIFKKYIYIKKTWCFLFVRIIGN